jgi:hypothetical protein
MRRRSWWEDAAGGRGSLWSRRAPREASARRARQKQGRASLRRERRAPRAQAGEVPLRLLEKLLLRCGDTLQLRGGLPDPRQYFAPLGERAVETSVGRRERPFLLGVGLREERVELTTLVILRSLRSIARGV